MSKAYIKRVLYAIIPLSAVISASSQGHPEYSVNLQESLDSISQIFIDQNKLSGSVAMVTHRGESIYQNALGMQSIEEREPMQINSLFRIASMTKPITATAILMLVDDGQLNLDDPASKYLPKIGNLKIWSANGKMEAQRKPITIRHLLMHTSGTRSRSDSWFREHRVDFNQANTLEEYVDLLLTAPLISQPGEHFNYAMNNDICARIVEIICGQEYGQFLQNRILDPLEMKNTWFIVPDTALHRLTSIYHYKEGTLLLAEGKEPVQSRFPRGNGQLVTTANDYLNFLHMLADGGLFKSKRVLTKSSVDELIRDALPKTINLQVGGVHFPDTGFGLSVAISRSSSKPWKPLPVEFANLFRHLPSGSYLWPGITNTFFWVDPQNKICGIVLSQATNPSIIGNFQSFTQTFYQSFLYRK